MRINCPSCKAAYEVPDALIGDAPRQLRCARCRQEWTVTPDRGAPEASREASREVSREVSPGPTPELAPEAATVASAIVPRPIGMPSPPEAPLVVQATGLEAVRANLDERPVRFADMPGERDGANPFRHYTAPVPPRAAGSAVGWLVSGLVILGALAAAYVWRADVMAIWPPSQRIYLPLGLH